MKILEKEFLTIVEDILQNEEFNKLDLYRHHKGTRLEHSIKVAYSSFKIAKLLKLDYVSIARAGLLHDFFLNDYSIEIGNKKKELICNHGLIAFNNANIHFPLNDKERNIIEAHMFPLGTIKPSYAESWVVSLIDKASAVGEFFKNIKYEYALSIMLVIISIKKIV